MDLFNDKRILTVSQLTNLIKGVLEENFERVWVEGELSNLAAPGSGHLYFTLKDAGAQLKCVLFRAAAGSLKFKLKDGMKLVVRGRVSVFAQRGDYQIIVEYLEPQGIGALQLAFLQLKERLAKEGLFAESRKKPIPRLPRRIGIVTSPTGAAIHDILTVLDRRFANLEVLIAPVKVQGEGAAAEIAAAIRDVNRYRDVDVLIVGRGGGSLEDLWAFNEETVARAIADSKIPIISAVGHEVDITIADLAADLRAPTPSAAAELVVTSKSDLSTTVDSLTQRLNRSVAGLFSGYRGRLRAAQSALRDPAMLIGALGQRIDYCQERIETAIQTILERRSDRLNAVSNQLRLQNPRLMVEYGREQLQGLIARRDRSIQRHLDAMHESAARLSSSLDALSPLAVLSRGYAIVNRVADRSVVKNSVMLTVGERLDLRFFKGGARCKVESLDPADVEPGNP